MKFSIYLFISFVGYLFVMSCASDESNNQDNKGQVFLCDVEKTNERNKIFTEVSGKDVEFRNTDTQSDDFAVSGIYSSKLTPEKPYGLSVDIDEVRPDDYLQVTVWRKSQTDEGVIVIDGGVGFYKAGKFIVDEKEDGWQKLFVEYFVPPHFNFKKLKIYVWNNSKDTIYFDDLEIIHRNRKNYSEYDSLTALQLYTNSADYLKFSQKRLDAFKTTVLVNNEEDYTNVVVFDGEDFLDAKYRLKGDLVDHLLGDKWSYRIQLKKDFTWKNMRTFSIQNPITRHFVDEWFSHKIFDQEGLLTTRYGFVPLRINDRSLGIYAWEEHFEKQLVESRERRNGPILRFDETLFWQRVLESNQTGKNWDVDYFNAAIVIPFKEGSTTSDSMLSMQLIEGQKLMIQFKNRTKPVSEIFDVDYLAKYYALIDIVQAYHGFAWHNLRFYFNPVTCLLEPIAFDGYVENGIYRRFDEKIPAMLPTEKVESLPKEELMLYQVFSDSLFNEKYMDCLERVTTQEYLMQLVSDYKEETDSLSAIIRQEFPYYHFSIESIESQAAWIRENLEIIRENIYKVGKAVQLVDSDKFQKKYTEEVNSDLISLMVHAWFDSDSNQINIQNFHNGTVKILGAIMNDRLPEKYDPVPEIKPFNGVEAGRTTLKTEGIPLKILFSIENVIYETWVKPWKYDNGMTTRQKLVHINKQSFPVKDGKIIFDGKYQFDSDVIIEDVNEVVFKPGTSIDLKNGAGFFTFSTIKINGTEQSPVNITSSDKTSQGFHVIQPRGKSQLTFANFNGLGNLNKEGWQSPAAVTFYEADVEIENCIFAFNIRCDDALNIVRSEFDVKNCLFENTFADAFDSDFSIGKVSDCTFKNIGNDAIDFSGSKVEIRNCNMFNISDKAISGGEKSFLNISGCSVEVANIGIASKDLSILHVENTSVNNTTYGMVAFKKKPEYGAGQIIVNNLTEKNNSVLHQIEEGSVLKLNSEIINGIEKNLAVKLYQ